ncbi:hypothetical protein ACIO52_04630 [Nocardia sp. NPDC087230]|uniref:hypothetical protein n=1 Tax=Nocardia sp. NPDC087230 TaxID=3364331 RepID=UPI0038120AAD
MLIGITTTTVLVAFIGGVWKWIIDEGPARLVAVLAKDPARREAARMVLEATKHQFGPEPGMGVASPLRLSRRGAVRGRRPRPPAVNSAAAAA